MINIKLVNALYVLVLTTLVFSQKAPEQMFIKSFNLLNEHYIDSIDQVKVVESAIKGMLDDLDPYTKLLIDESKDNHDKLSKGKYGGIGIRIGSARDTLFVLSTMSDGPAYMAGLKAGDKIISVGEENMISKTTKQASEVIKGELGTSVELGIMRPGADELVIYKVNRNNIRINNIGYKQIDHNSIGYIKVNRFSRNISNDFVKALKYIDGEAFIDENDNGKWDSEELYRDYNKNGTYDIAEPYGDSNNNGKYDDGELYEDLNNNGIWDRKERYVDKNENGKWDPSEIFFDYNGNNRYDTSGMLKGLIIDLRGNGGGLLSDAKKMIDILIEKNQLVLYTKGRDGKIRGKTFTKTNPVLNIDVPIAILVNSKSASASEILSGAIQDLDRGVIIGKTTLGKGLVQRVRTLNDSTSLKITSEKYYTPSGRLIQKEDWLDNGVLTDGKEMADSIFYTLKNNRKVKGGGGIVPDITIDVDNKISPFINALWRANLFSSFSANYLSNIENLNNFKSKIDDDLAEYIDGEYDLECSFLPARVKNKTSDIESLNQIDIIDDKILKSFKKYLVHPDYNIEYAFPGEEELESFKNKFTDWGKFENNFISELFLATNPEKMIQKMEDYYSKQKNRQFANENNKDLLVSGLEREFARFLYNEEVRNGVSLRDDEVYFEAVKILKDLNLYNSILGY